MDHIALAFSGGGFRAAFFSLGALAYLNRVQMDQAPLLQRVKYISSTSGGSITNLAYSSHIFRGKTFEDSYKFLFQQFDGERLLKRALQILVSRKYWKDRPEKARNLINAFSIAYDELLGGLNFKVFENREHHPHLEEICINSTEFTNGLVFRFQSLPPAPWTRGKVGNATIYFLQNGPFSSGELKLGDILASSSCFPSGFEPMIFPGDYTYGKITGNMLRQSIHYEARKFTLPESLEGDETPGDDIGFSDHNTYNSYDLLSDKSFDSDLHFGLMDGGVSDNQAIDAFKKADERRNSRPFDLFIACDVTSYLLDGYTLPLQQKKWFAFLSVRFVLVLYIMACLVLPASFLLVKSPWPSWLYVIGTVSGLMLIPILYQLSKKLITFFGGKKDQNTGSVIFNKYKGYFYRLRLGTLKQMILSRVKSVFILANDIYLKQIRRLYYQELFNNPFYKDRSIQNAIYDLSKINFPDGKERKGTFCPSQAMIEVAEKARLMGTTLWFDNHHLEGKMKEHIIATGQFTTCYNLLKYLQKKAVSGDLTNEEITLQKNLLSDWELFKEDPFYLL